MKTNKKILISLFFLVSFLAFGINKAYAQASPIATMEDFRDRSIDVYQNITINYTQIGGGGSFLHTIRSDGRIIEEVNGIVIGRQTAGLGAEARIEVAPSIRNEYTITQTQMMHINDYEGLNFNYTPSTYYYQRTNFSGYQTWYDISTVAKGENTTYFINPKTFTGTKFTTFLLPPYDVAYDYCRKHNLVLNGIENITTHVEGDTDFVDFLTIQKTEALVPDTNLDDGYDLTPVSAPFPIWAVKAIVIAVVALVILLGTLLVTDALGITNLFGAGDQFNQIDNAPSQNIYYNWTTPEINQTALFQSYLDFTNATGETPSMEGYYEFTNNYFDNIQKITPEAPTFRQDNNWSSGIEAEQNSGSLLSGFLSGIMPIIQIIIIIIAFVFGMVLVVRALGYLRSKD
jgi:hypothetical protein